MASRLALVAYTAALALPAAARAQLVRGTVTDTVSGTAVAGAIVRLLATGRDTANVAAPAVLTDERGRFTVRVPAPGRWIVETKRIGVRPTQSAPLELAAGETRELLVRVAPIQPRLAAVRVVDRAACAERVTSAEETATLWEDVRAALLATRITSETEPPTRLVRWARRLHRRTFAVVAEQQQLAGEGSARFAGVSGETLSRYGYIVQAADGWIYNAPDAEGLLSAAFVRDHCFRPTVSDRARGRVGLAFEPAADRRLPDIAGVLWLDAATSELRRLEYRYTRLPHDVRHDSVGGYVDFARRDNGTWLVRRWAIRMPEISLMAEGSRDALLRSAVRRATVTALLEEGGEATVAAPAGAIADSAPPPTIAGTVWDSAAALPLVGARVAVEGAPYAALTDEHGRYALTLHEPGRYAVVVQHARVDTLGVATPRAEATVPRGEVRLDLALPTWEAAAALLCPGGLPPGTGVVHGRVPVVSAEPMEDEWRLALRWEERVTVGERVAWRAVEGVRRATVPAAAPGTPRRVVLCGVPASRELRATIVRAGDGAEGELRVRLAPGEGLLRDIMLRGRLP